MNEPRSNSESKTGMQKLREVNHVQELKEQAQM